MHWREIPSPLIVIVGPTAVGKTELSIRLAEKVGGEIVSVDSRYFYRGMDVGTAKPTPEEMARVPHHLIDVANPDEVWSLALFKQAAREAIELIHQRGNLPFLVGGTGQYVQAVIEDWQIPEQAPDPRLRTILTQWADEIGPDALHAKLALIDPAAAQKIMASNVRRTIRAFEVFFHTGKRFSEQSQRHGSPYSLLKIGLKRPRSELYERIDLRIEQMFEVGFLQEVEGLLKQGYDPDLPSLSAIGYREAIAFLQGKISLEEAKMLMKRITRQFVRRQSNWFKESDETIHWFDMQINPEQAILDLINSDNGWILPERSVE